MLYFGSFRCIKNKCNRYNELKDIVQKLESKHWADSHKDVIVAELYRQHSIRTDKECPYSR